MGNQTDNGLLWKAARRAAGRPFFLASYLYTYQALKEMSDEELAQYLGSSTQALPRLALCRRPDPAVPAFPSEVRQIAAYAGVDPLQLVRLLREVDATQALRQPDAVREPDAEAGMLLAARDRLEPLPPDPPDSGASKGGDTHDEAGE